MAGRHRLPARRGGLRWVAVAFVALLVAALVSAGPADASTTTGAQLTLSGVASGDNPTGGSQLGVHPGDKVRFTASLVPSAGLPGPLKGLADGLLSGGASLRVVADFKHLPGGKAGTVITPGKSKTFGFPSVGKYGFTYSLQKVELIPIVKTVTGLLGNLVKKVVGYKKSFTTINLNGNQLQQAGIKLNAQNQYVGTVVVAKKPPKGGVSVQLPTVKVAPSAPVVGQLPTVTVPGTSLPTVGVPTPSLPKLGGGTLGGGKTSSKPEPKPKSSAKGSTASGPSYTAPGISVPEEVVPQGSSGGFAVSGGGGGAATGLLPDSGSGLGGGAGSTTGSSSPSSRSTGGGDTSLSTAGKPGRTVELAADPGSPSSQLPVLLAIVAVVALALVAGTYARLILLKKQD